MLERYKVLCGMVALKEFSADELARFTKVKLSTVRTVIIREKERLLDVIGKKVTGDRGGQFNQYKIKSDQFDTLRTEIEKLYKQTRGTSDLTLKPEQESKIPLSLLVAEDILRDLIKKDKDIEESRRLFEVADLNFQKARAELEDQTEGVACSEASMRISERLQTVEKLQQKFKKLQL